MRGKSEAALDDSKASSMESGQAAGRNRDQRIAQIILAAQQTFQEDGYAAFATRRVAARVGITLGNLQYYFRTREELLRAALQAFIHRILEDYQAIAGRHGSSARQRYAVLVDRMVQDIQETDLPKFMFELWAFSRHDSFAEELVHETYAQCRSTFAKLLSEIQRGLTSEECVARASILLAQTAGMMIFARYGGDSDKDYAEFIRVTKRSLKSIGESSTQALEDDAPTQRSGHRQKGGDSSELKIASERKTPDRNELFDVGNQRTRQDVYYRPTVQGKRREVKINEIVSCAANLLAEEGYANFTQARVARTLGILPSALQNYFPTHDDLLRTTIDALMKTYLDRYTEMGKPSAKHALERLAEIVEDVFEEARDTRICQFSFEMFALAQHSDITRDLVKRNYSAYRSIYVELVREIDASATARECLARATLIAAQMEGAATLMFGTRNQQPNIDRVFELMRVMAGRITKGTT